MRLATILTLTAASAAVCACSPMFHHRGHGPYKVVSALTCPDSQGDLTRKSAAADGKSCEYATASGDAVSLQLVSLAGTNTNAALAPLEAKLRAETPAASGDRADPGEGRVDIDLPGIHIHASGKDNDHDGGQVKIGRNVTINEGNTVVDDGKPGGVNIEAHDNGAEIRVDDSHGGVRRVFFLASDTPGPNGYKVAGYEVRGPAAGPLVVATMLTKSDDHDQLRHDAERLIRLNVGG
ncbi:MAG TPA: hypothetical protein VIB82_08120 [Caulobacteraceae bacterium]|jgi:hypothetical protein